jgi:hypothetical protein
LIEKGTFCSVEARLVAVTMISSGAGRSAELPVGALVVCARSSDAVWARGRCGAGEDGDAAEQAGERTSVHGEIPLIFIRGN